jgi:hypothetical protein
VADLPLVAAAKFEKLAAGMKNLQKATLVEAAKTVQTAVRAELVAVGAGSGRLRGVGKKGGTIGVRYDVLGPDRVVVRATGQFQLLESNTKAHRIPKMRSRQRVVVIPGIGVRAWANHPGTKGKHPWAKGVVIGVPLAGRAEQTALRDLLAGVFR